MHELSQQLRRNLTALRTRRPDLVKRLSEHVATEHIRIHEDGRAQIIRRLQWEPLGLSDANCETILGQQTVPRIILCGIGLGELLAAAIKRFPNAEIMAWERDPYLLRLALDRHDLSAAIASGRLRLLLGADLAQVLDKPGRIITHPHLVHDYTPEVRLLQGAGPPERGWVLLCHGELFVDDLSDALEREGYACFRWDVERLLPVELETYVDALTPALVATINYRNGLSEACAKFGLPLLCWEIDPTIDTLRPCPAPQPHASIFTWRNAHVAQYGAAGFPNVYFTPLAASTHTRHKLTLTEDEQAHYGADVCFVGASCMQQAPGFQRMLVDDLGSYFESLGQAELPAPLEVIQSFLAEQRKDLSRFVLPALFNDHLPGFEHYLRANNKVYDPSIVLGELAAAEKRLNYIAKLGPFNVQVWGDPAWNQLEGYRVRYRGSAGHRHELTKIYNAAKIHVDIGRIYQPDIVTMRVFDVLACGGFLLAEYSEGLKDLFELGEELVCYRNQKELIELVGYYLAHQNEAQAIAERGKARVESDHTIQQRLAQMLTRMGLNKATPLPLLVG